jgi:glycosyltransferase involved in cell wall biosynthesis
LRDRRFDLVQATDCSFPAADICYAHFCHRAYLKEVWPRIRGRITPRTIHSWASHALRAVIEARLVRAASVIVVCSEGLKADFARTYDGVGEKVTVIHNTVDLAHFRQPSSFDRRRFRERMDTDEAHTAFVFVTLGHFERKGLPLLLEALSAHRSRLEPARLWVVGGEPGLVASYRAIAESLGIAEKVTFAGRTDDVRPFLWSADAFVSPSHYEAFSAAVLEAAASGLPLIATGVSGSEELVEDGVNGFEIEISAEGVAAGLRRFLDLDAAEREAMRRAARKSVEPLGPESFADAWRALYASLAGR